MSDKYDVIVIGAGIGGLTAAAILARNGKKVLVLEKNPVVGGYAVCFKRGEFEFEASLHMICGCAEGGATYKILEECGVLDKITFLKSPYLYRVIFPDFDLRVSQNNPQEYIDCLIREFPSERFGIEKIFKEISRIHYEMVDFFSSRIPSRIEILYFPLRYPKLCRYVNKTFQNLLDRYLKDFRLKAIISQLWEFIGLPPSKASVYNFSYIVHDYLHYGGYYPKGGSQILSNAFAEVIKENNGEIILNTEAEKIMVEHCNAKGVIAKDKEFFGDVIISNLDAIKTFSILMGEKNIPKKFFMKLLRLEPSLSAFQVYLGLNTVLKEKGIMDYEIFLNPSYDFERHFKDATDNNINDISYTITLYSNLDEAVAPIGKSTIGIVALVGYDYWAKLPKEQYEEKKKQAADIIIKRSEKIIPHLSSHIEEISIATPITMGRYTGSYKGAIYGWSQIVPQSGINRLAVKTPVKNVYLSSAWTQPGGGVAGVMYAGQRLAKSILKIRN